MENMRKYFEIGKEYAGKFGRAAALTAAGLGLFGSEGCTEIPITDSAKPIQTNNQRARGYKITTLLSVPVAYPLLADIEERRANGTALVNAYLPHDFFRKISKGRASPPEGALMTLSLLDTDSDDRCDHIEITAFE